MQKEDEHLCPSSHHQKTKYKKQKKVAYVVPLVGHHISFAVCVEEVWSVYLVRDAPIAVVFE